MAKNKNKKKFANAGAPAPITSLQAQGVEATPAEVFQEYGVNRALLSLREYVPELATRYLAIRKYDEMMRSDAQVRAVTRACKIPILAAKWYVEPASDSQDDRDVAEFVDFCLDNMSITWSQLLEEVMHMVEYGFSCFEIVYELGAWAPAAKHRKKKQYALLRKLAPRPAMSIARFQYDANGGPSGVWHVRTDPNRDNFSTVPGVSGKALQPVPSKPDEDVFIPIDKLLVFTFDKTGGNLEGFPLLRTIYKHWYIKEQLYKIDAIQKERHGIGVPKATLPPGASKQDKATAAEMLRNIRTNEDSFILEPPGWVIDFAEVKGNLVDPLASAEHHDLMISRLVLAQFINQGGSGSSSGGRATSGTQYDLYLKSLRHLANMVADVFNLYLIPKLVDYNFEVDRYPKLRVRGVGDNKDNQQLASAINNLVTCGAIIPDDGLESWLREIFEAPDIGGSEEYIGSDGEVIPRGARQLIANPTLGTAPTNGNPPSNGKKPGRKQTGRMGVTGTEPANAQ